MKKIVFILCIMVISSKCVFSQANIIKKQEVLQVLDHFLDSPCIAETVFGSRVFVIKISSEYRPDCYSIAISTIGVERELPQEINYCFVFKGRCFFIILVKEKSFDHSKIDNAVLNTCFFTQKSKIREIADTASFYRGGGGVLFFPTIILYKAEKESPFLKTRKIQFEIFHPIDKLPKQNWPVEKFVNAITDQPYKDYIDKYGKPTVAYENLLKCGKGKFRIKTR